MEISDVRIRLADGQQSRPNERIRAYCSCTLDRILVICDLKIVQGTHGLFVAMPSRKLCDHCPGRDCCAKNELRARYCKSCGIRLDEDRAIRGVPGRAKLHVDVAHPIDRAFRQQIHTVILTEYARVRDNPTLQRNWYNDTASED